MAVLMAAVSSVEPLPVAPKEVTLMVVSAAPMPESGMVVGELLASLTTVTFPSRLPTAVGAKDTFRVTD